jgi:hypothetical protein
MFHWVTGIPFDNELHGGAYDDLTLWEQIDDGAQYTPSKKWLFTAPILLFVLSTITLPVPLIARPPVSSHRPTTRITIPGYLLSTSPPSSSWLSFPSFLRYALSTATSPAYIPTHFPLRPNHSTSICPSLTASLTAPQTTRPFPHR